MARLLILAEGQSEEIFAKRTLIPHLSKFGVHASVTVLRTKRIISGGGFKGGVVSYGQVRKNILELLRDTDARVTTLLDFYGLSKDFPALEQTLTIPGFAAHQKALRLQEAFSENIGSSRFIPFLALHEFEAWLFTRPEAIAEHFGRPHLSPDLHAILSQAGSPEEINNHPTTHPSARIKSLIPIFKKTSDGPTIIEKISISTIRAACPHFAGWLATLEDLAPPQ